MAYRGTTFHGWQQQNPRGTTVGDGSPNANRRTVQSLLSTAVAHVVGHPVSVIGASRTDAGVHAKGQVCHFDTTALQIPVEGLRLAVNAKLPGDVAVLEMEQTRPDFHAIYDAVHKRYQYVVWARSNRNVFMEDLAFHRWLPMDFERMRAAARHFVGEHDFESFARPGHGRETTVRTVTDCQVSRRGPLIVIGVAGKGFLWNQVRIMAGTLVEVGLGRFAPEDIPRILRARDRRDAGSTAPACGLYLQWIQHSDVSLRWPPRPTGTSAARASADVGGGNDRRASEGEATPGALAEPASQLDDDFSPAE